MDQADNVIEVGNSADTAWLLDQLKQFAPGSRVELRVPSDTLAMRTPEDYTQLRDAVRANKLKLTVVSPEPTIIGLSRIYGFAVSSTGPRQEQRAVPLAAGEEEGTLPHWPSATRPAEAVEPESVVDTASTSAPEDPYPSSVVFTPSSASASSGRNWGSSVLDQPPTPIEPATPVATDAGLDDSSLPWASTAPPADNGDYLFGGGSANEANGLHILGDEPESTPLPDVQLNMPDAPSDLVASADVPEYRRSSKDDQSVPGSLRSRGLGGLFGRRPAPRPETLTRDVDGPRSWTTAAQAGSVGTLLGAQPAPTFSTEGSMAVESASSGMVASGAAPAIGVPVVTGTPRRIYPDVLARPTRSTSTRSRQSLLLPAALIVLLLLLLGGVWAAFSIVPTWSTADITIAAKQFDDVGPVQVSVPVSLGGGGRGSTVMNVPVNPDGSTPAQNGGTLNTGPQVAAGVEAQVIQKEIVVEETRATTGGREVPNNAARGTLQFTNTTSDPVYIPSGTEIGTARGKKFITDGEATVEGTDFYGHAFGVTNIDFVAVEPGPDSNDVSLSGSYGTAVFTTLNPTAGGDTRTIRQVSDADVNTLLNDLRGRIAAQAATDALAAVPADMVAIASTVAIPEDSWKPEFNHPVGEDADDLYLKLTALVNVYAYRQSDVDNAINATIAGGLVGTALPIAAQVDPATIAHGEIVAAAAPQDGVLVYTTTATARVNYTVTETMKNDIRQIVVGKKPDEARMDVMNSKYGPYINDIQIETHHPFGLTVETVPDDASRIEVKSGDEVVAATPEPK